MNAITKNEQIFNVEYIDNVKNEVCLSNVIGKKKTELIVKIDDVQFLTFNKLFAILKTAI